MFQPVLLVIVCLRREHVAIVLSYQVWLINIRGNLGLVLAAGSEAVVGEVVVGKYVFLENSFLIAAHSSGLP